MTDFAALLLFVAAFFVAFGPPGQFSPFVDLVWLLAVSCWYALFLAGKLDER